MSLHEICIKLSVENGLTHTLFGLVQSLKVIAQIKTNSLTCQGSYTLRMLKVQTCNIVII